MFWDSDDYCTLCGGHGHLAKDCHLTRRDVGTIVGSLLYISAGLVAFALSFLGAGDKPVAAVLFGITGGLLFIACFLQYGKVHHQEIEIDSFEAGFQAGYDQALADLSRSTFPSSKE